MVKLSIIILAHENCLIPYLTNLEPLIKQFSTELIIINETPISPILPLPYELLVYPPAQTDLSTYAISNCTGDYILLLEAGLELTDSFIDFLKRELEFSPSYHISCSITSYLTANQKQFYEHKETILYHRASNTPINLYWEETLRDYSLLLCTNERFPLYARRFLLKNEFLPFFTWFTDYCIELESSEIDQCYTTIEQIKRLELDEDKSFDDMAVSHLKRSDYAKYLGYSSDLSQKKYGNRITDKERKSSTLIKYIRHFELKRYQYNMLLLDCKNESLYFSWLFKDIISIELSPLLYFSQLKETRLHQILLYLLETDPTFSELVQSFLRKDILIARNKKEIKTLFTIYHTCLNYLSEQIESLEERDQILKLYAQYKVMAKYYIYKYRKVKHLFLTYQEEESTLFYYNQAYLRYHSNQYPYRLSICMIVKDSEQNLKRCLKSLRPLLSSDLVELIIVDTGSNDGTVSVASTYTLNVFFHTHNIDLAKKRNKSIMYAKGEYLMIIDDVEELTPVDCQKLLDFFYSTEYKEFDTYCLPIHKSMKDSASTNEDILQPRIFKNDGTLFFSSKNNQPIYNSNLANLSIAIQHND